MTKENKTSRAIKESAIEGKVTKEEVKAAVKGVKDDTLAEWKAKVEADLNAMAERCYEKRYLQINSHKPEFVDLKKETK